MLPDCCLPRFFTDPTVDGQNPVTLHHLETMVEKGLNHNVCRHLRWGIESETRVSEILRWDFDFHPPPYLAACRLARVSSGVPGGAEADGPGAGPFAGPCASRGTAQGTAEGRAGQGPWQGRGWLFFLFFFLLAAWGQRIYIYVYIYIYVFFIYLFRLGAIGLGF